ncbi:uncharacterized protein PG986_003314 [Apiospora aurea]|uniref:Myb-like domain-containing protein n=1 Tax=Apiospora aurea TaxID=335848 RepID=A0ABR1QRX3_9PEZI
MTQRLTFCYLLNTTSADKTINNPLSPKPATFPPNNTTRTCTKTVTANIIYILSIIHHAPKKNTDNGDASGPAISGVNWKLIDAVFKSCPANAKPNLDWNALAVITGHKNGKSARDSFRQACDKFGWFKAEEDGSNGNGNNGDTPGSTAAKKSAPKKTPKAPKQKASPKIVSDDASDNEADIDTPTKKRKGGPKNGLETPMKKTKLIDEDEAKDEVKDEPKDEVMAEDKDEHAADEV